jgi:hypothetical protein
MEEKMSQHASYLDRMTERLSHLESKILDLAHRAKSSDRPEARRAVADLGPHLDVTRSRLHELRRRGAELDSEATQSFGANFERLSAAVGKAERKLH